LWIKIRHIFLARDARRRLENQRRSLKRENILLLHQRPSLRNKTIKGTINTWEFSINKNYRCIYRKEKEEAYILAIVKHEDTF